MKRILYFLVAISVFGCSSATISEKVELVMEIDGMSCSHSCSPFIQKKLTGTEGVVSATVDFETKLATVIINSGIVTQEEIIEKVKAIAGGQYKVKSCRVSISKETKASKASLEKTSDFDISEPDVSVSEFKLPNFFKILNLLLN